MMIDPPVYSPPYVNHQMPNSSQDVVEVMCEKAHAERKGFVGWTIVAGDKATGIEGALQRERHGPEKNGKPMFGAMDAISSPDYPSATNPNPMLNTVAGRGVTVGLRRNHDYHDLYEPDPKGQAASGNARVWKVYLDDADVYDSDMASLFSAVVTSFISQTSQILQPNDGKITSALLVETNRLLRAAGNITKIDTVPPSSLGLNSTSYTSRDVWVNGLFFTSLTLAVTTSLLTVLAKQWIQAYIEAVPGDAKTQAMVRQFRFDGLVKWNLKAIIEGLPLILHTSVAIFLVGLSLYVSQISHLICIVISSITALTFIFYIGTTMIPAFSIDCPYRLSSMFIVMRLIMIVALPVYYAFRHLVAIAIPCLSHWSIPRHKQRSPPLKTLKREESFYCVSEHTVWSCLSWLFGHSTNTSTKDIVVEGVCDVLNNQHNDWKPAVNIASFLRRVMGYSLHRAGKLQTISDIDDIIYSKSCWGTAISLILSMSLESLPMPRKEPSVDYYDLARDIFKRYSRAFHEKQSRIMINCLWFIKAFQLEDPINMFIFRWGDRDDFRCALAEVHDDMFLKPGGDITWLHRAA
ncbi:hypothetical protein H0H93_005680, partial [Arthromyces matolae]